MAPWHLGPGARVPAEATPRPLPRSPRPPGAGATGVFTPGPATASRTHPRHLPLSARGGHCGPSLASNRGPWQALPGGSRGAELHAEPGLSLAPQLRETCWGAQAVQRHPHQMLGGLRPDTWQSPAPVPRPLAALHPSSPGHPQCAWALQGRDPTGRSPLQDTGDQGLPPNLSPMTPGLLDLRVGLVFQEKPGDHRQSWQGPAGRPVPRGRGAGGGGCQNWQ